MATRPPQTPRSMVAEITDIFSLFVRAETLYIINFCSFYLHLPRLPSSFPVDIRCSNKPMNLTNIFFSQLSNTRIKHYAILVGIICLRFNSNTTMAVICVKAQHGVKGNKKVSFLFHLSKLRAFVFKCATKQNVFVRIYSLFVWFLNQRPRQQLGYIAGGSQD